MGDYRSLLAFKKSFDLAMKIFRITKKFPSEEKFGLISQTRNSSRSVCTNIVEAYKRRRYRGNYLSKLNDSESENAETQVWLDFALKCEYIDDTFYNDLSSDNNEVAKLILYMINNPDIFL